MKKIPVFGICGSSISTRLRRAAHTAERNFGSGISGIVPPLNVVMNELLVFTVWQR